MVSSSFNQYDPFPIVVALFVRMRKVNAYIPQPCHQFANILGRACSCSVIHLARLCRSVIVPRHFLRMFPCGKTDTIV